MSSRRGLALVMALSTVLAATAVAGPIQLLGTPRPSPPGATPSCHTAASSEPAEPAVNTPAPCDLPARLCVVACFGVPEIATAATLHPPPGEKARFGRRSPSRLNRSGEMPEPVPRAARA